MTTDEAKKTIFSHNLYASIAAFYFFPIAALSLYSGDMADPDMGWIVTLTGLLMATIGTLVLILTIQRWEQSIRLRTNALLELKIKKVVEQNTSFSTTVVSQHYPNSNFQEQRYSKPDPIETILTPSPYTSIPNQQQQVDKITQAEDKGKLLKLEETLNGSQRKIGQLSNDIENKNKELRQAFHELDNLKQEYKSLNQEFQGIQKESSQKVKQKESLLGEYQQTIVEQRGIIEKKQTYISKLETKIRDLSYEVKALLQLGDIQPSTQDSEYDFDESSNELEHPLINAFGGPELQSSNIALLSPNTHVSSDREVQTPYDAALQLQKCISIAKKLRGIPSLSGEAPRFVDMSLDNYTIDMRRLFDRFRNETSCSILVYSLAERKPLFINNQIKNILGWPAEKVVHDFYSLMQKGRNEWNETLAQLPHTEEGQARILLRAKDGRDVLLHCHLAMIPNEVFNNQAIAILYPA